MKTIDKREFEAIRMELKKIRRLKRDSFVSSSLDESIEDLFQRECTNTSCSLMKEYAGREMNLLAQLSSLKRYL